MWVFFMVVSVNQVEYITGKLVAGAVSPNYVFNVSKASVVLSSADVSVVYGNDGFVTVFVSDVRATGKLVLHIKGQSIDIPLSGKESYSVKVNSNGRGSFFSCIYFRLPP